MTRRLIVALLATLAAGCGDAFRDPQIEALGGEFPGTAPSQFHRPGQPCVLCHDSYEGAEPELSIGGTLFFFPPDSAGFPVTSGGFVVSIVDSKGKSFNAEVNCFGNFSVEKAVFDPAYPILAEVLQRDEDTGELRTNAPMSSRIGRDGSCASCHIDPKSWLSPGPVFVNGAPDDFEPPSPSGPCAEAFQ